MTRKSLVTLLVLLCLLPSHVLAQKPVASPPQTDEERKAERQLERKALVLLDDVIKASETFKLTENRILLRATAANLLWEHDEVRARALFKDATASFADLIKEREADDAPSRSGIFGSTVQLRTEIVQMLGERDARMAREFLRATRPRDSSERYERYQGADQVIEINLAIQLASTEPKQAAEIGVESLSSGISYSLPQLVSALREKDPEAASKLASEILVKLRAEKLDSNRAARQVAFKLLETANEKPGEGKGAKDAKPLLDQAQLRELTEMMAAEALRASSSDTEILYGLQELMPVVEKYAPARAAQLKRKFESEKTVVTEASLNADEEAFDFSKYRNLLEKGSAEELLAAAASAPEHMQYSLYMQAVSKILEGGNTQRARQVINENIKDPNIRKALLDNLEQQLARTAAEQGRVAEARKMIAALRTNEERATAIAQLASGAAAKGEKKVALELLDEAREMVSARAKNFTQLGAQLAVARAYAPLDAPRSLSMLEPVVDQLNELLAAAVTLGGFMTEDIVSDDEITVEPLFMASKVLAGYLADVRALARADFERTRALADRFQREEIRTISRLLIVQSILSRDESGTTTMKGFMMPANDFIMVEFPRP